MSVGERRKELQVVVVVSGELFFDNEVNLKCAATIYKVTDHANESPEGFKLFQYPQTTEATIRGAN